MSTALSKDLDPPRDRAGLAPDLDPGDRHDCGDERCDGWACADRADEAKEAEALERAAERRESRDQANHHTPSTAAERRLGMAVLASALDVKLALEMRHTDQAHQSITSTLAALTTAVDYLTAPTHKEPRS